MTSAVVNVAVDAAIVAEIVVIVAVVHNAM